jgi:hypothetical protein
MLNNMEHGIVQWLSLCIIIIRRRRLRMAESTEIEVTIDNATDMMLLFCGHEENYNGSDNKDIDYICGKCTQRLCNVSEYIAIAKELNTRQAQINRAHRRITRGKRQNRTLSNYEGRK